MRQIAEELARRQEAIAVRAMDEMYRDPFWEARFGERGRKFAREDGLYHLRYLREALLADDASLLVNYARWLRSVLVPRGMCTAHVVENFQRLARILVEEKFPDAAKAKELLDKASEALEYEDEGLRQLQRVQGPLRVLASYLADAVALGDPAVFAKHVQWARGYDATLPGQLAQLEVIAPEGPARAAVQAQR